MGWSKNDNPLIKFILYIIYMCQKIPNLLFPTWLTSFTTAPLLKQLWFQKWSLKLVLSSVFSWLLLENLSLRCTICLSHRTDSSNRLSLPHSGCHHRKISGKKFLHFYMYRPQALNATEWQFTHPPTRQTNHSSFLI